MSLKLQIKLTAMLLIFSSTTMAQELLKDAPLEMIKPSRTPIIVESDFPVAPSPRQKKKKVKPPVADTYAPVVTIDLPKKTREITEAPKLPSVSKTAAAPRVAQSSGPARPIKIVMPVTPISPIRKGQKSEAVQASTRQTFTRGVASDTKEQLAAIQPENRETTTHTSRRKKSLGNVRVANIWAMRNGTKSGSFIVSWDPVLLPVNRWNFGATVGAAVFESETVPGTESESFLAIELGLSASYYISRHFLPEVVVGIQRWSEEKATNNMLIGANLNYLFKDHPKRLFERMYVGYAQLSTEGTATTIIRAGVGFKF